MRRHGRCEGPEARFDSAFDMDGIGDFLRVGNTWPKNLTSPEPSAAAYAFITQPAEVKATSCTWAIQAQASRA